MREVAVGAIVQPPREAHGIGEARRDMENGDAGGAGIGAKPARHWRMVNEVPTVLMIGIVIMVIVKPF